MGGISGHKSSSTTTNAPPSWALPNDKQAAGDALNLYNSGQGGNVYQGQRVTDLSGQTTGAVNGLTDAAGMYKSDAVNRLATGQTSSGTNLADMASGKMVGNNPYFNDSLQGQLDQTANQTMSQFAGAGRYGSAANTNAMTTSLGNVRSNALSNQYNQDVHNQIAANQQIDAANQGQLNSLNNLYQGYSNAERNALTGGQVIDKNNQDKLNADWDKWSEEDNRGWNRIKMLEGATQGAAGNYGTQTTNSKSRGFGFGMGNPLKSAGGMGASATK